MKKYFKIGEIAKLYNIGVDSLRYYEKIGIIHPLRSDSGYRMYSIKEISKLNVLRDLRELGFDMEMIKEYLDNQNLDSSLELLKKEKGIVDDKLAKLNQIETSVTSRIQNIEYTKNIKFNHIELKHYERRKCYSISRTYHNNGEMDVLMKALLNKNPEQLFVMGNNRFGTMVSVEQILANKTISYDKVFVIDPSGDDYIEAGDYLSIFYKGAYTNTIKYAYELFNYAKEHNFKLDSHILEILWIDSHTSTNEDEFITELQFLIK